MKGAVYEKEDVCIHQGGWCCWKSKLTLLLMIQANRASLNLVSGLGSEGRE